MSIINLGSLNIDRVFRVPHIVSGGETIGSRSFVELAGGKGANQSMALARAGVSVLHVGRAGHDGAWLIDKLAIEGVDTRWIRTGDTPTGQAIIQVDDLGQNAIVLNAGANREVADHDIVQALAAAPQDAWILTQNETSGVDFALARGRALGLRVAFNPSPCDRGALASAWREVALLCLNEVEASALSGETVPERMLAELSRQAPGTEIVLTLGPDGALYQGPEGRARVDAARVPVIDTTAAGDTFLGYFLAGRSQHRAPQECLDIATAAAALCVTRAGAMDSIPRRADVLAWLRRASN
jgi:ribokinase